jgi:glutaredoxin
MSEYPLPSTTGFTVYTKTGYRYCDMVNRLLASEPGVVYIDCDQYSDTLQNFWVFIESVGCKDQTTFPIVFYNGTFEGGFTEALKCIQRRERNKKK